MQTITENNTKPFGCLVGNGKTSFRIFSPNSLLLTVEVFDHYDQEVGRQFDMKARSNGIWELEVEEDLRGKFYGYRIKGPANGKYYQITDELIADPWCTHVASKNTYRGDHKSYIPFERAFNWEGDTFLKIEDPRDLIIYEAHIKDLTAHKSSKVRHKSTYLGFIQKRIRGGIQHLKELGVNAVEFLPLQKFAGFEPPFLKTTPEGYTNEWNPYARNYWGYMTSFYFAPEPMYASDGSFEKGAKIGISDLAGTEIKMLVKELHKAGIAVILDVVYNHVSQYDLNPLKFLDKQYYFRLNENGDYLSHSGCGNDFKTESPLARKLIVESVLHWMHEYHIDGFRFDLANLIDRETIKQIKSEAEKVNPHVILIAEPWGGGYDPTGFSELGWPSWNDQIRNGVKGSDPINNKGFIFGEWQSETSREGLENFLAGTLLPHANGRYHTSAHTVNYLEAHDGYTLGDFIRIGLRPELLTKRFSESSNIVALNSQETQLAKLAALYLFSAQGITMIHAGQEWARPKIIEKTSVKDSHIGRLDHNSYEKDNTTNYLNFDQISHNTSLYHYYLGLIALRKSSPALRKSPPEVLRFGHYMDALQITCHIMGEPSGDPYDYYIALNGNRDQHQLIKMPSGFWEMIVSPKAVTLYNPSEISGNFRLAPSSGMLFRKLRQNK